MHGTEEMRPREAYGDTSRVGCVPRLGSQWGVSRFIRGNAIRQCLTLASGRPRNRESTKPRFVLSPFVGRQAWTVQPGPFSLDRKPGP